MRLHWARTKVKMKLRKILCMVRTENLQRQGNLTCKMSSDLKLCMTYLQSEVKLEISGEVNMSHWTTKRNKQHVEAHHKMQPDLLGAHLAFFSLYIFYIMSYPHCIHIPEICDPQIFNTKTNILNDWNNKLHCWTTFFGWERNDILCSC